MIGGEAGEEEYMKMPHTSSEQLVNTFLSSERPPIDYVMKVILIYRHAETYLERL